MMETRRNNSTGEITVTGEHFIVIVRADGHITVSYPSRTVHVREDNHIHSDEPSPRAAPVGNNQKRGSR